MNLRNFSPQNLHTHSFCKSFLPRKFPAIRYMYMAYNTKVTYTSSVAMPPFPTTTIRRESPNFFWNSCTWQQNNNYNEHTNVRSHHTCIIVNIRSIMLLVIHEHTHVHVHPPVHSLCLWFLWLWGGPELWSEWEKNHQASLWNIMLCKYRLTCMLLHTSNKALLLFPPVFCWFTHTYKLTKYHFKHA